MRLIEKSKVFFVMLFWVMAVSFWCAPAESYGAVSIQSVELGGLTSDKYAWTFDTTSQTESTINFTNFKKGTKSAYWNGGNPDSWKALDVTDTSLKGKAQIRYSFCGEYVKNGQTINTDILITVLDWGKVKKNWYLEKDGEYRNILPHIAFEEDDIEFHMVGVEYVDLKYEILQHGTNNLLDVDFHATCSDLDVGQAFQFKNNSNVDAAYILKGNKNFTVDGNKIISDADSSTTQQMPEGWVTLHANHGTAEFTFYYGQERFNSENGTGDYAGCRVAWLGRYGIGDNSAFLDWFGFTAWSLVDYSISDPIKDVGDVDFSWRDASDSYKPQACDSGNAYGIDNSGTYDYLIRQSLTPNDLSSFTFTDTLDGALQIQSFDVLVVDKADGSTLKSANGKFDRSINGQTVTASAISDALNDTAFTNNKTYYFRIRVKVNKGVIMANRSTYFINSGKPYLYYIPNHAELRIVSDKGKILVGNQNGNYTTPDVWAQGKILFTPVVNKTTDYEYRVGDIVPYTVTLQVKNPDSFGTNIRLSDVSLPEGLTVQPDSLEVSGVDGAVITSVDQNGWLVTVPLLNYGDVITVRFSAVVTEAVNGQEITNKVGIDADNIDPENPPEGDPDIDEWNNSPQLSITKDVAKYEYKVGEKADYTLVLTNTKEGTIAKNVVISDESLPDGLVLDPQGEVTATGIPQTVEYPVQDSTSEYITQTLENSHSLSVDNNTIVLNIAYLPSNTPVTVQFSCIPQEEINGMEVLNTATATAENVEDKVQDEALVWINSPVLEVTKNADKDIYRVGDVITYTVTGTQKQPGCVARNVTFEDTITTEGVTLQKNSIVLLDENQKKINADIDVQGNHFLLKTNRHLIVPDHYVRWDKMQNSKETIEQATYNPLAVESEKIMTLEYQVVIVDEELAGKDVDNMVVINCDEDYPDEDPEKVPVYGPILSLEKISDKQNVKVGEIVHYTLTATQQRDGVTANNVVITDNFLENVRQFVEIQPDSLIMKLNGKQLENTEIIYEENVITAKSHHNLAYGEKLTLEYDVKAAAATDEKVINQATASSDNTEPAQDDNAITIGEDKPLLEQTKKADKETVKVNDVIHYTVTTMQQRDGAVALNVVLTDTIRKKDQPYVKIKEDTIQVKVDDKALKDAEITCKSGEILVQTHYNLSFGEKMTLEYDVEYRKATKDRIQNTATATADNAGKVTSKAEVSPLEETPVPVTTTSPGNTGASKTSNGSFTQAASTIASAVKTGDNTGIAIFVGILLLAAVVVTVVVFVREMRKNR